VNLDRQAVRRIASVDPHATGSQLFYDDATRRTSVRRIVAKIHRYRFGGGCPATSNGSDHCRTSDSGQKDRTPPRA
jgi:hypothetical protein